MDKRFLAVLAAIVIVLGGVFLISQNKGNGDTNNSGTPSDHVEGQGKDSVTLVEYGDYECPICAEYYAAAKQVETQFSSQIYYQFRNLPLTSIHPNAMAAARAAEAASLQGKFWQMHDLLYQNQDENGQTGWVADTSNALNDYFVKYAQQIGLDVTKFKNDYASSQVYNTISADQSAFAKTGEPEATPTFFLDGKFLDNSTLGVPSSVPGQLDVTATVANFAKVINAEIAAKH